MDLGQPGFKRAAATLAAASLLGALIVTPVGVSAKESTIKRIADGKLKPAVINVGGAPRQLQGISGSVYTAAKLGAVPSSSDIRQEEADAANPDDISQFAVSQGTLGCNTRNSAGINVRVNQDCTFRRQAEEIIKINPADPRNIIAGQNDSRIGYNKCGFDYSFDNGRHWGDGLPPFYMRENHPENDGPNPFNPNTNTIAGGIGTLHTYDVGSDPAETFDSAGRAFFSCVVFDANTNSSGVIVTQSPQGAGGSFYDNVAPGTVGPEGPTPATKRFIVVEDNSPTILHDKEFIAADAFAASPNRDNVYVTWTIFRFGANCAGGTDLAPAFCESPIFGSMSTDHALTWSTPEQISGVSPLCFFGNSFDPTKPANACNFDSGSDPQPMPDGSLVVPFFNQNTGPTDPNFQQLAVVCHPSGSSPAGTAKLHCGAPSKVGSDVVAGEPQCNFGRGPEECIPGPWIRTNDFPRVGFDKETNSLYVVWQDYRNGEYDIQISRSNDGGLTWQEGGTVNPGRGTDQYFPAIDVGSSHKVAVSYYKSDRVPNENTTPTHTPDICLNTPPVPSNCFQPGDPGVQQQQSSYWLSGRQQPAKQTATPFSALRISPFFPPPDGSQIGFNGDYSGLAVHESTAHPIWSDTRNSVVVTAPTQGVVHDEDVFTDSRPIPSGRGNGNDDTSQ